VVHLEFLVVYRKFHKSLVKCSLTYVQYSFDQLFMRCQHSKVVHRIFFFKLLNGPKKVENHWFKTI